MCANRLLHVCMCRLLNIYILIFVESSNRFACANNAPSSTQRCRMAWTTRLEFGAAAEPISQSVRCVRECPSQKHQAYDARKWSYIFIQVALVSIGQDHLFCSSRINFHLSTLAENGWQVHTYLWLPTNYGHSNVQGPCTRTHSRKRISILYVFYVHERSHVNNLQMQRHFKWMSVNTFYTTIKQKLVSRFYCNILLT